MPALPQLCGAVALDAACRTTCLAFSYLQEFSEREFKFGVPYENRTRVAAVKEKRVQPLKWPPQQTNEHLSKVHKFGRELHLAVRGLGASKD